MTVKIVTDSTCDLPVEIIRAYDITVIPLYINLDGKSYLDGVELTREEFYKKLPYSRISTSAPGMGTFIKEYERLKIQGATDILSIHISKSLSNVSNVALIASEAINDIHVMVMDSGQLSLGLGLLVLEAARAAADGQDINTIIDRITQLELQTYSYAYLNTLEYLRRGGRLNDIQQGLASILDIKPIMKMHGGEPKMEMVRTHNRSVKRVTQLVVELGEIKRVGVVHANALKEALEMVELLQPSFPAGMECFVTDVTPVLGVHVGPGAVCVCCIAEKPLSDGPNRMDRIVQKIRSFSEKEDEK
jgi:DegV family protein with EDD domain